MPAMAVLIGAVRRTVTDTSGRRPRRPARPARRRRPSPSRTRTRRCFPRRRRAVLTASPTSRLAPRGEPAEPFRSRCARAQPALVPVGADHAGGLELDQLLQRDPDSVLDQVHPAPRRGTPRATRTGQTGARPSVWTSVVSTWPYTRKSPPMAPSRPHNMPALKPHHSTGLTPRGADGPRTARVRMHVKPSPSPQENARSGRQIRHRRIGSHAPRTGQPCWRDRAETPHRKEPQ